MKPRIIKRQWIVWVLLLLPLSAAMALPTLWPRLHPSSSVSDLYRRYEHNPHIRATEIHNFRVNDTLAVNALLLEASTDSAWCSLMVDFGAPKELIDDYSSKKEFIVREGLHDGMVFYMDRNNSQNRLSPDNPDSRVVIGSFAKRSLCVFMTADTQFKEIIFYNELEKTLDR